MDINDASIYRSEAEALAEIGRCLFGQNLRIRVQLPAPLAARAVVAWERDDVGSLTPDETPEERSVRHQAGALALIGLAVGARGTSEPGHDVTVDIDAWQIGSALDAADKRGLLADLIGPNLDT